MKRIDDRKNGGDTNSRKGRELTMGRANKSDVRAISLRRRRQRRDKGKEEKRFPCRL